ncbi:MAG TPA: type VI secretion system membrane subunit TssM [Acetobacteraceae bacterium]|nr:type VI secretion system membrane subunit TssM [Acetobacteraceae bacterium]
MQAVSRFFQKEWVESLMIACVVALAIWFFGPLLGLGSLHPFESVFARILGIIAVFVLWLIFVLVNELRERKKEKELEEGVAKEAEEDASAAASAEEVALLTERLKEAMHELKRAKLGGRSRRHLYQLPWYMFIGPPGAGKTTALVNCGLHFPLADEHGPKAVQGVGGTRNCDWWFTDEAVLIDTAGRYTTQDSDAAVDAAAWLGFLKLLKKHRSRQPLNGVLVAISLSDLALLPEADRLAHARAIRKRIRELADEFGIRVPVYVMFTKADLIAGFVEFFDNLGREEREQVWGTTFALDTGKSEGGAIADFSREFDLLMERLNDRMLERVHQEPDLQRRRLIYGFPQQIASLRDIANEFLTEAFRPSRLEARPLLRGIYITSGTQDGTPIDRLLGAMAGQFGLARQAVSAFSGTGRSYFLTRLVRGVVFGEAGLVGRDPKVERRRRWRYIGAYAGCAVVLIVLTTLWTISWIGNRAIIANDHDQTGKYNTQYAALARRGSQDTDLAAILPALGTLRDMDAGYSDRLKPTPISVTFGLYQGYKLSSGAIDAYDRALNGLLLPRLLSRLELQMQQHLSQPDFLYEALKVYLMLGREGPLDRQLIEQWTDADFNTTFPGEDGAPIRQQLADHVKALLQYPLEKVALNGPLVAQVRGILTREPLSEYIYNQMIRSAAVQELPPWTVADHAGPAGSRVFQLRDGKPLNSGIPGIFTWEGYHQLFLPLLPAATRNASEATWVLGRPELGAAASIAEMNELHRDILGEYFDDYTRRWDALLANIALKPFGTLNEGLNELYLLSAPQSPLRDLLEGIDEETQLTHPAGGEKKQEKKSELGEKVSEAAGMATRLNLTYEENEVLGILGAAYGVNSKGQPNDPAIRVDEHFATLHEFVTGKTEGAPNLDASIKEIQKVYEGMLGAANAPNQGATLLQQLGGGAGGGGGGGGVAGAAEQLQQIAQNVPKPVAAMLQTVSQSSSQVTASGASTELQDAWKSQVLPLCQAAFNRYPFVAGSSEDVPIGDFVHLLGPDGLMEKFFDQYLKPLVDTTTQPWQWQSPDHTKLGLSPGVLSEFERADDIRQALFANGGAQPMVQFQLVPVSLDPGLAQVSIDIAGQTLTYAHGPIQPMMMQWPGRDSNTLVRLTMTPAGGGSESVTEKNDTWSLLRLLDSGHLIPTGQPDKFRIVFSSPAGKAEFELNANSVRNPFNMSLRAFRCPPKL